MRVGQAVNQPLGITDSVLKRDGRAPDPEWGRCSSALARSTRRSSRVGAPAPAPRSGSLASARATAWSRCRVRAGRDPSCVRATPRGDGHAEPEVGASSRSRRSPFPLLSRMHRHGVERRLDPADRRHRLPRSRIACATGCRPRRGLRGIRNARRDRRAVDPRRRRMGRHPRCLGSRLEPADGPRQPVEDREHHQDRSSARSRCRSSATERPGSPSTTRSTSGTPTFRSRTRSPCACS